MADGKTGRDAHDALLPAGGGQASTVECGDDCLPVDPRHRGAVADRGLEVAGEMLAEQEGAVADDQPRSGAFREACRALRLSYVVIVPRDWAVTLAAGAGPVRADSTVRDAVFEWRSAGNGTKGPRRAWRALAATADPEEFLLARRLDREKNPCTYYLCHAAPGRPATLRYLACTAARRWSAESTFKRGKDGFGWDQSQVAARDAQNPPHPPDGPGHDPRHLPDRGERRYGRSRPPCRHPGGPNPPSLPKPALTCGFTPVPTSCPPLPDCPARSASRRSPVRH